MFKKHENSTHDDILLAHHKTPNFNISQVRIFRSGQAEIRFLESCLVERVVPVSPILLAAFYLRFRICKRVLS
jgi:hypothetical protein